MLHSITQLTSHTRDSAFNHFERMNLPTGLPFLSLPLFLTLSHRTLVQDSRYREAPRFPIFRITHVLFKYISAL